jgi:hypothetical protein
MPAGPGRTRAGQPDGAQRQPVLVGKALRMQVSFRAWGGIRARSVWVARWLVSADPHLLEATRMRTTRHRQWTLRGSATDLATGWMMRGLTPVNNLPSMDPTPRCPTPSLATQEKAASIRGMAWTLPEVPVAPLVLVGQPRLEVPTPKLLEGPHSKLLEVPTPKLVEGPHSKPLEAGTVNPSMLRQPTVRRPSPAT